VRPWLVVSLAACSSAPAPIAIDADVDASPDGTTSHGQGLVASYTMEALAKAAPQVPDVTTHGHDGTCTTCPVVAAGKHGMGYQFDGTDIIQIDGTGALVTPTGFTVAAWFNVPGPELGCFVNKVVGDADANSWQACMQTSGVVTFYSNKATGSDTLSTPAVTPNVWHHVALRWDGAMKSIYYDGVLAASIGVSDTSFDNGDVLIGGDLDFGKLAAPFKGMLDDVQIYDVALSAADIATLATP
jgi:hypothetical protein